MKDWKVGLEEGNDLDASSVVCLDCFAAVPAEANVLTLAAIVICDPETSTPPAHFVPSELEIMFQKRVCPF